MSNYHFDEESLLELAKGIDDKGFKTTIKCNIGEDGFVESGSLDLLTKPGIYKLQICVLSDELKQELQNENIDFTGDVFGYCYVNVLAESKITRYGQQTVVISENLSKLNACLINLGMIDEDFSFFKALPKLLYTRMILYNGTNYTFSDWEEKTDKEVEISINLEAFSDLFTGDEAAIEEAKKNIFIVPTDLDPDVYIAKVDITPFIYNLIPDYYTASIDSSGLSYNETPSGGGYYELTVEDVTISDTPINEWRGKLDTIDTLIPISGIVAKLYRTGYNTDGSILEPKTLLTSIESNYFLVPGPNTIYTEYGDVIITCTSDGTKPSLELYTQTYGKLYLRWQLTVDENKIPESIIYNQILDFTTSFNSSIQYDYCPLQVILLEQLSGSGKVKRTIENGVNSGWQSIDRIGVNVLNLILVEAPIKCRNTSWDNGLEISHAIKSISSNSLSSSLNGNFQAITAVGVDSWGHVDSITTTNYSVNPATSTQNGLMSSNDKTYIESIKPVLTVESDKLLINKDTKITGDTELVGTFRQGSGTVATGLYSHAEGMNTTASANLSHVEGYSNTASGDYSHAEGESCTASGEASHAEGGYTTTSGNYSHAEGASNTASGDYSHAEGAANNAEGLASHAEGEFTQTNNEGEHSEGKYNISIQNKTIHTVGIGGSDENRKNAHEIHIDGKHYIHGIGGYDGTNSQTEGVKTLQEVINNKQDKLTAGTGIIIDENNNISINFDPEVFKVVTELPASPAEGDEKKIHLVPASDSESGNAYDEYIYVDGSWEKIGSFRPTVDLSDYAKIIDIPVEKGTGENSVVQKGSGSIASGELSFAEGGGNTASGWGSHAEGSDNTASGDSSHAEGQECTASGLASHSEGRVCTASGNASHAEGLECNALGDYSHAEGVVGAASGYASHSEGSYTIANNRGEHSEGIFNVSNTGQGTDEQTIHSVGIGTSESDRKNAVEIMQNGDYYMLGVGGYQGTNPKTQDAKVKTTQEVINGKQDILKAGTNISIEDNEVSATGYKFNTELPSFVELSDILMSHYIDITSGLPPASITFTGAAGSTTYNVGGEYTELLNGAAGMMAVKIGDGLIALLTSYDPESNTATFDKSLDENNDLSDTPFSKIYMYISIAFSGDANATTYSFVDMAGVAGDFIMEGGKIKIGNYPIATIVSIDAENHTITLDKTLDPDNAVSNAMFDYIISPTNTASGYYSHAEGLHNTASGNCSHAEGESCTASGNYSHAEGASNTASGDYSHAEGASNTASGDYSHAEGDRGTASGYASHAEGGFTTASGKYSHAEGASNTASGDYSHAEGDINIASGYASHAEGYLCKATGDFSRATGVSTTASHLFSNVNGRSTKSSNAYQTVIGRANADKEDALFIVGNGTTYNDNTVNTASNAFVVTSSGNGIFSGSCTASAFPTSSDSRLKDVISDLDISRAYNLIENCSTILYTLKSEADLENKRVQLGLLAQEVKEFFPEIVYEDSDGFLSLDYSRLTVIILKVLKDVINRISILENKI